MILYAKLKLLPHLQERNFFSEEEVTERYMDKVGQLWQNDKCEGGLIID